MVRSVFAGMSDYSQQSLEDIVGDLLEEADGLSKSVEEIKEAREGLRGAGFWSESVPDVFRSLIGNALRYFEMSEGEMREVARGLTLGVQKHHCRRLSRIGEAAGKMEARIGTVWHREYGEINKDYSCRNFQFVEKIYAEARNSAVSLVDLFNMSGRLQDFVGSQGLGRQLESSGSGSRRPLVLSVHGIRTRGKWQKELAREITEADFVYQPLDYGWFSVFWFLVPALRRRKIEWFRDEYARACRGLGQVPSVVGHSFGSYLIARSMELYEEIRFDKVILCGSIVKVAFPWGKIVERGQVGSVLNEIGHRDVWASVVEWVVEDAGPSGVRGFTDSSSVLVQRTHPEFRHSDFFYSLNYSRTWVPFLKGVEMTPSSELGRRPFNWRYRILVGFVLCLLAVAVFVFVI